jgi:geranylgeranyl diphosphate synthase type I
MIEEVILWQMIDVNMMLWEKANESEIQTKNLYKTAKYTFTRPMTTGAILANATNEQIQNISALWTELWLAFQTKDDLIDLTNWDPSKSRFSDIQEWQQTIFTNYIFNKGTSNQKTILQTSLWKKLSNSKIKKLQEIFQSSGAIQYWKNTIKTHIQNAEKILNTIDFPNSEYKQIFFQLTKKLSI